MASLLVNKSIVNGVYIDTFTLDVSTLSDNDKQLLAKHGEPVINAGGAYGSGGDAYTLPDEYIKIVSGLPFTQKFDPANSTFTTHTQTKAEAYITGFLATYQAALAALRALTDTFSGQQLVNPV